MKKVLKFCVVVAVMAMMGTTMAALDINSPLTFDTNGQPDLYLTFPYLPPSYAATQDGTMVNVDDSNYHLIISSDPGTSPETLVVSWEIVDVAGSATVLAGTMENFLFWDENNNIPTGASGEVWSSADYATSGAWQGVGLSEGAWSGTYDGNPYWSGTVVITAVPEPATMCLLGLGGLLLRRKRA